MANSHEFKKREEIHLYNLQMFGGENPLDEFTTRIISVFLNRFYGDSLTKTVESEKVNYQPIHSAYLLKM